MDVHMSRKSVSSFSIHVGTHNAAIKWKSSLLAVDYLRRKNNKDPGTFNIKLNNTAASRLPLTRSRTRSHCDETCRKNVNTDQPQFSHELAPSKFFSVALVRGIMSKVLHDILDDEENTNHTTNANLCKLVADEIKQRVKALEFVRYKIVSVVYLTRGSGKAGLLVASRCLWDSNFDNFVQEIFQNKCLLAVATVYVTYFE